MSGLKPLVEPCLKQTLKSLPRPDVWNALGPVPSACLLFLGAYYQAWSRQVSAACLPACLQPHCPLFLLCWSLFCLSPWMVLGVNMAVLSGALIGQTVTSLLSTTLTFPFYLMLPALFPRGAPESHVDGTRDPEQQLSFLGPLMHARCCVLEPSQGCLPFRKMRLWKLPDRFF